MIDGWSPPAEGRVDFPEEYTLERILDDITEHTHANGGMLDLGRYQHALKPVDRDRMKRIFEDGVMRFKHVDPMYLRDVGPALDNIPVVMEAQIIAVMDDETYTESATFKCPECEQTVSKKCDRFYHIRIPKCKEHRVNMEEDLDTRVLRSIKTIMLQEFPEDAKSNSPAIRMAEILDDDTTEAFVGDRKSIVARMRSIPNAKNPYNKIVFEILEMKDMAQKVGCMPSEEELVRWHGLPDFYDRVIASLAPELFIRRAIKESVLISMAGGEGLNNKRSNIHTLLIGDAQLAKSELLLGCCKVMVGSKYADGVKASKAGLSVSMKQLPNGNLYPAAGTLPQMTNNLACLDEVDKMKEEDRHGIYECMEQQTATYDKAGWHVLYPCKTTIIAAGNPKNGKYNLDIKPMDNFGMSVPFITRFDLIWLIIDEHDDALDEQIVDHALGYDCSDNPFTLEELQRAFSFIRTIRVKEFSPEIKASIKEIYKNLRSISRNMELQIGMRHLYGLYRMVAAMAKLHLRDEATLDDVRNVRRIMMNAIMSLAAGNEVIDIRTNKQARNDKFITVWTKVEREGRVDKEAFIAEYSSLYQESRDKAERLFDGHVRNDTIALVGSTGLYGRRVRG